MRAARSARVLGVALVLALLAAAPATGAPARFTDSVTGRAVLMDRVGLQLFSFDLTIEARSGPSGEAPAGAITGVGLSLPVTCLAVTRRQAIIGARGTQTPSFPYAGLILHVVDNAGLGIPDVLGVDPRPVVPTTCAGERVPLGVEGPISSGDLRVVDAPPAPTSTQQCRSGGWRAFGTRFADQAQCVAYVKRRARAGCLAERAALGRAAFRATYGRGPSRLHALRRCLRAHAV